MMKKLEFRKAIFKRAFKGKQKVPYRIRIRGDRFQLGIKLKWEYTFFKAFIEKMTEKTGKELEENQIMEGDQRVHDFLIKNMQKIIDSIETNERQKIPGLKFVNIYVKKDQGVIMQRVSNEIHLDILLEGLCVHSGLSAK